MCRCNEALITAPREWVDSRIWILVINVADVLASTRKQSLDIKFAKGTDNFVTIEKVDTRIPIAKIKKRNATRQAKKSTSKSPSKKSAKKKLSKKRKS